MYMTAVGFWGMRAKNSLQSTSADMCLDFFFPGLYIYKKHSFEPSSLFFSFFFFSSFFHDSRLLHSKKKKKKKKITILEAEMYNEVSLAQHQKSKMKWVSHSAPEIYNELISRSTRTYLSLNTRNVQ